MKNLIYFIIVFFLNFSVSAQSFITSSTNTYLGLNSNQKSTYDDIVNLGIYKNLSFINISPFGDVYSNNELHINYNLIADTNIVFVTDYANIDDIHNQYFYGKIIQDEDSFTQNYGTLLLSKYNGFWAGSIKYNTKDFDIYDLGGGVTIIAEVDYELPNMVGPFCEQADVVSDDGPIMFTEDHLAWDCNKIKTKVLFLYTSEITNNHNLAVSKAIGSILNNNYVWQNSKIYNEIELAGVEKINFSLSANSKYDVDYLSTDVIVQNLRDNYEADLVVLFVPDNQYGELKGEAKKIANKVAQYQDAYALVSFGLSVSGQVFTHEVGHLYGGRHQKPSDNTNDIHHARYFEGKNHYYWTMMSVFTYEDTTKPNIRLDNISNPIVYFGNKKTGLDSSNNSIILNYNKHTVASFYMDTPQPKVIISMSNSDCSPDGTATANLYCEGDNSYSYSWSVPVSGAPGVWMTVGTGPSIPTYTPVPNSGINSRLYKVTVTDGTNYYYDQKYTSVFCTYLNPTGDPYVDNAKKEEINYNSNALIFPNPVKDNINLAFELDNEQSFAINIYDINGRLIKNIHKGTLLKGKHEIQYNIADLVDGMYILKFESKQFKFQEKFQKVN